MLSVPSVKIHEKITLDSKNTAIIVIDMQNDFVHEKGSLRVPSALGTVYAIKKLIDKARRNKITIIYTKDTHYHEDPEFDIWGMHAKKGTWGWEIVDELKPTEQDYIIEKQRYDAFYGTCLDDLLRIKKIENLVIVGTVANICVLQTASSASMRWYKVIVPMDGISALDDFDYWLTLRQIDFVFKGIIVKNVDSIHFV